MEGFKYVDIFATKGLEYIFVVGFLGLLVFFWRYLNKPVVAKNQNSRVQKVKTTLVDWFYLANDFLYHQGHSWVMPEGKNTVFVGMDDFAQKLLGLPANIELPKVGSHIKQGERGWKLTFNGKSINMLSPVNGKVVAVNNELINNLQLLEQDPYQKGWLLKVIPSRLAVDKKNLISGALAKAWIEDSVDRLSTRMTSSYGVVLQDGGVPVSGFAKEIAPDNWDELAREFLLSNE